MPTPKTRTPRGLRQDGAARRAIQEPYRLLFENNPHPMWVYDLETLAFLAVNDTAVRRYGYSREEFLGMTIKDIRPPEDVPALLENVARVDEGLDEAGIWRHRTKDGTLIEVEIVSHTLTSADRKAVLVLAQDVTDRRRAEQTLRESERRLATLFRSSPDMVGIVSVADGRYLDVNDEYVRILGYARDELIGRRIHEMGIWADALPRATLVEALTRDGAVRNWELQHRAKSGRVIIGLVSAELIDYAGAPCVLSVTRDITEPKRAEVEIEELARFPGENPNPVLRVLGDGVLVYANRASASLLRVWACQVGQRLPDPWLELVQTAFGSGSSHTAAANIEDRVLSLTFAPVAAEYVTVYGLDITTRKHVEAALREREAKLRSIFRATPAGVGAVVHRVLKAANQRLCEMGGYAEDELVNQGARLLYPTEEDFAYVGREKYAEEAVRTVGTRMLEWSGFQVLTAADGDEVLGVYRQHADTIVCVLLDLTMPGLSGEETFAELRRVNRDVRVVLSSGYDAKEIARRFEGHGPADFIQKPYTMEALRAAARSALD